MDASREKVNQLFPSEKWTKLCARVFIAGTRAAQGAKSKSEQQKLSIEIAQARILAKHGHYVYLVPEAGCGKHYDALVDGVATEFKKIRGGIGAVGKRFNAGMKQGLDVFLKIDSPLTIEAVYHKLKGEVVYNGYANRRVYIYLDGKLREWSINAIGGALLP